MPTLPLKGLVAPFVLGCIGCAAFASSSGEGAVKTSGSDTAKNPRFVLGKGSNGTELYVKVESSVHEQFNKSKDDQGKEVTLWFGGTKLTKDHKLWPWGTGNKYSLVEWVMAGQYRLQNGITVSISGVDDKLKSGDYEHITLNQNKRGDRGGNAGSSIWGNQCKQLGNGEKGDKEGGLQVRCIDKDNTGKWDGAKPDGKHVTVNLTKNDYVLTN